MARWYFLLIKTADDDVEWWWLHRLESALSISGNDDHLAEISLFGADDDGGDHHRSPLLGQTKALVKNTNKEETIDRESADEEPNGCDGSLAPITSLLW